MPSLCHRLIAIHGIIAWLDGYGIGEWLAVLDLSLDSHTGLCGSSNVDLYCAAQTMCLINVSQRHAR